MVYKILIFLFVSFKAFGACHTVTLCTFEGVSGNAPDTSTLNACTFGSGISSWSINNQQLSFQSSAQHDLINNVNVCTVGNKDGTGSTGFQGLLTTNSFYQPLAANLATPTNRIWAGVSIKHSFPINVGGNQYDFFTGYSANGAQFCNAKLVCLGGTRWIISMETPAAPTQNDIFTPFISNFTMDTNSWFRIVLHYDASSDATNMEVYVYSQNLGVYTLEELLQNTNSTAAVDCTKIDFGIQTSGTDASLIGICGVKYDNFLLGNSLDDVLSPNDPIVNPGNPIINRAGFIGLGTMR